MLKAVSSFVNVIGALNYKGTWDASTNNPTLASGVGTKGDYYVVSVAGSTNIDGQTLWGVGDWITFNGTVWQRVDGGSTGNFTTINASSTVTGAAFIPSDSTVPTNGMYLPAANTVSIATSSAEAVRITSAGRIGIGSTNPSATLVTFRGAAGVDVAQLLNGSGFGLRVQPQTGGSGTNTLAYVASGESLSLGSNNAERMRIDANGNVAINTAAIATNATNGFLYVPSCAGTPTGTPTTLTGRVPIVVDTTNNKLYFYSGAAWRDAGP